MFDDKKILCNTLWNILKRGTYDEVFIGLGNNLIVGDIKIVIMSTAVFVEAVILIEIDFNKIANIASEMTSFYNSSNSQILKYKTLSKY